MRTLRAWVVFFALAMGASMWWITADLKTGGGRFSTWPAFVTKPSGSGKDIPSSAHNGDQRAQLGAAAVAAAIIDSNKPASLHAARSQQPEEKPQGNASHAKAKGGHAKEKKKGLRIAILVSGSLRRYVLNSTVWHLVYPMARQGHTVDYYLALSTGDVKAWRQFSYMQYLTWDPLFGPPATQAPLAQQAFEVLKDADVKRTVQKAIAKGRGNLRLINLFREMSLDDDKDLAELRKIALKKHPDADPDANYPVVSKGKGLVAEANRNILRLYRAMQGLWKELLTNEKQEGSYDFVLFLRDDAHFLADFNLRKLIGEGKPADVYILSCNARTPTMLETEINDHAQLFTREKASLLGDFYSWLITGEASRCKIKAEDNRRCISEESLSWFFEKRKVQVKKVNQNLLPFERVAHVTSEKGIFICMHKYCNSRTNPLNVGGLIQCKNETVSRKLARFKSGL